ncbi:hypothetical protein SPAR49_0786 [Streptococcus pneumoniae GA17328]|nr:hypothetical protein SPAR49_0786 [Streptococcus pneumoniae GA17328]
MRRRKELPKKSPREDFLMANLNLKFGALEIFYKKSVIFL